MNNYLLSIDPSIKNTGFTLWENKKPIWIASYSFKKDNYEGFFKYIIDDIMCQTNNNLIPIITSNNIWNGLDLIIERGTFHSKNGIGYETQEHLRGFIAGQFNKLLTKDMLISPFSWKKWYVNKYVKPYWEINYIGLEEELKYQNEKTKWNKLLSLLTTKYLIKENNWNIKVNNHDEADSLLIGWYFLNKENK